MSRLVDLLTSVKSYRIRILILFIILIYIPILLNIFIVYNKTLNIVKEEKLESTRQLLSKTTQSTKLVLSEIEKETMEIGTHKGIIKTIQDFDTLKMIQQEKTIDFILGRFDALINNSPYINNALIITEKGRAFSKTREPVINIKDFINSDLHQKLLHSSSDIQWIYDQETSLFYVIHRLNAIDSGNSIGFLFSFIDPEAFSSLYKDITIGVTGEIRIYDENHESVLALPHHSIPSSILDTIIEEAAFNEAKEIALDHNSYGIGILPIDNLSWYMTAAVPIKELTGPIRKALNNNMWVIFIVSIVVGVWILIEVIVFSRVITNQQMASYRLKLSEEMNQKLRIYKHDFMNHLQIVQGLIEIHREPEALDYLRDVTEEGKIITSRYEIGIPELESAIFSFIALAEKNNIDVKIDTISLPEELPIKLYDLIKILTNLLKNGVHALQHCESDEKLLGIEIGKELGQYVFKISNNVPLIPEGIRNKIFLRGFSTKVGSEGGLGLYIVKKLVEKNNGGIELQVDESGNHFIVYFPE